MIKIKTGIEYSFELPEGYQFVDENGNVINATKIVLKNKKKEYPKSFKECQDYLGEDVTPIVEPVSKTHRRRLIGLMEVLLTCRDAYWKIAGNWKPCFDESFIYAIGTCYGTIEKRMVTGGSGILLFPTEEMRDAFYENFKEEIESVKELL